MEGTTGLVIMAAPGIRIINQAITATPMRGRRIRFPTVTTRIIQATGTTAITRRVIAAITTAPIAPITGMDIPAIIRDTPCISGFSG